MRETFQYSIMSLNPSRVGDLQNNVSRGHPAAEFHLYERTWHKYAGNERIHAGLRELMEDGKIAVSFPGGLLVVVVVISFTLQQFK